MANDNFRHQGLRQELVNVLLKKGIKNPAVLNAIGKIPRHLFMEKAFINFAYQDKAFPIGSDQTISHPYTVAFQSELLDIKPREKVLEVGTGSGYQTAVLLELKAQVFTIERQKELFHKTKQFLPTLNYQSMFFYGDGYKGLPSFAPFDKIIVTCGAPFVPEALLGQLKLGGRLVIPVGDTDSQKMTIVDRLSEEEFKTTFLGDFSFVPMLPKKSH